MTFVFDVNVLPLEKGSFWKSGLNKSNQSSNVYYSHIDTKSNEKNKYDCQRMH